MPLAVPVATSTILPTPALPGWKAGEEHARQRREKHERVVAHYAATHFQSLVLSGHFAEMAQPTRLDPSRRAKSSTAYEWIVFDGAPDDCPKALHCAAAVPINFNHEWLRLDVAAGHGNVGRRHGLPKNDRSMQVPRRGRPTGSHGSD